MTKKGQNADATQMPTKADEMQITWMSAKVRDEIRGSVESGAFSETSALHIQRIYEVLYRKQPDPSVLSPRDRAEFFNNVNCFTRLAQLNDIALCYGGSTITLGQNREMRKNRFGIGVDPNG